MLVDEIGDVAARGLSTVAEAEDAADLGEGEAGVLGIADEREAAFRGSWVVAVAA